jgi:alpha-glucosidase
MKISTPVRIRWVAAHCMMMGMVVSSGAAGADDVMSSISSPGKVLTVTVLRAADGRLSYAVARNGKPLIAPSRLGFVLANAAPLDAGFSLAGQNTSEHDSTWEQPWGERRFVRNHYKQLRLDFTQGMPDQRGMSVVFRVFDDGVGFRYELPAQKNLKQWEISAELTEFVVAPAATAWWQQAGEVWALEYPVQKSPLAEVGLANTPLTIRASDGTHIAFHEAALVDYASMWLRKVEGQKLRAQLAPSSMGPAVVRGGAFTTPWRTMQIADNAAGLYMSDLVLNLNEPNALGDVSWFKPSKYVGIWWEMHLGRSTWSTGAKHGATTANTRRYIDFAADNGFRGVLVEGWNVGWDGDWAGGNTRFDFTKAYPDFDLPALSRYAQKKGVHLIGHHETGGDIANYERQMDGAYRFYAKYGVDSVKTGYVTDAGAARFAREGGGVRMGYTDSQEGSRHYLRSVQSAARHRVAINTHEPIKDTGLRRTYPNWISREGARGVEYNAWGNPVNSVDHEALLVFTRMLSGPMDYTPGILSLMGADGKAFNSTQAKQLANFVVIYSPIAMAADLPENYAKYPSAFKFIRDVPTDWSDTIVVNGAVGEYATIARKDRRSDDWYVGSVTDGNARTLSLPLAFLEKGKRYVAQIYRDGDQADYRSLRRFDLITENKTVTAADTLELKLAPGGGQAIRFTPER